jgi:hypothetical protein
MLLVKTSVGHRCPNLVASVSPVAGPAYVASQFPQPNGSPHPRVTWFQLIIGTPSLSLFPGAAAALGWAKPSGPSCLPGGSLAKSYLQFCWGAQFWYGCIFQRQGGLPSSRPWGIMTCLGHSRGERSQPGPGGPRRRAGWHTGFPWPWKENRKQRTYSPGSSSSTETPA